MPHFAPAQGLAQVLPVTERLGTRLLGLPMAHDLPRAQMERIVRVILTALQAG
jgi:dTDP-4-amino-4,6-dideoxygalactose transaminase